MTRYLVIYIDKLISILIIFNKMTTLLDNENSQNLVRLGLSPNEAKVYQACLTRGELTIHELTHMTGISRTTIYGVAEYLQKKGLISFVMKQSHRIYCAESPEKLKRYFDQKQRDIEQKNKYLDEILPDLKMVFSKAGSKPVISFYQGREEVRNIFEDVITSGAKEVLFVCEIGLLEEALGPEFLKDYIPRRVAAGIRTRGLYASDHFPDEELYKSTDANLRTVRLGPPNLKSAVYTGIYQNKVYFISSVHEAYGVVIESKDLSESMKTWFEALWNISG